MSLRASLIAILLMASVAQAEPEAPQEKCFDGQYVVSVSDIAPLQEKARQALEAVNDQPMFITEENPHAILIEDVTNVLSDQSPPANEYDPKEDLCLKLRKVQREARAAGGGVAARRNFSCSCNHQLHADATPNDPYYYLQWGAEQSSNIDMDLASAWNLSTGSSSVVVGIIDTGVDYNHPDLAANIWRNTGEIPNNGIDDDGNGYIDDYYGFNAITYNGSNRLAGNPFDDVGHGTHVAGTIGALGNNGTGVAGMNWRVSMVPIKFLGPNGGSTIDAIEAVDYATTLKVRGVNLVLTNNSWGGGGYSQPLADAITRARDNGILFVAAAGNSSQNNDQTPSYPSSYANDNIIAVAAVDSNGALASFSSYGATSVDIGAPGVNIASTYPNNAYQYMSGTSMATPHISGVLALLKSYAFNLDWRAMRDLLYSTATPLSSLSGKTLTGKMANAGRLLAAVNSNPPPTATPVPTPTLTPTPLPTSTPTPVPSPTPTPTIAPGDWTISGTVVNGGTPISGAKVTLTAGSIVVVRYSDASGVFRFDALRGPVNYTLSVSKAGFAFYDISSLLRSNVNHTVSASARMYALTVKVLRANKQALSNVPVDAGAYGSGVTNINGSVTFSVPLGSTYSLRATPQEGRTNESSLSGKILGDVTRVFIVR